MVATANLIEAATSYGVVFHATPSTLVPSGSVIFIGLFSADFATFMKKKQHFPK